MKTVLQKAKLSDLIAANYNMDEYVLVAVSDDLSDVPSGEIVANLSFGAKALRTLKQNKAIHKFCEMVSTALNNAGWTKKKYFEIKQIDIEWTPASVKEDIWRVMQIGLYPGKESTTQLDRPEVSMVYENVNRIIQDKLEMPGIEFPNRFFGIKYNDEL